MATTTLKKNDPESARQYFADKLAFTTGPVELDRERQRADIAIVDVRAAEDFQEGHIPGAVNLPKEEWSTLRGLRKDALNVIYCYSQVCHLAATAALEFASKGYSVMELEGGFKTWKGHDLEIEKKTPSDRREQPQPALSS